VAVLLGLVGNVATGLIEVPHAGKPWVLAGAALLAVAAVLVDVLRDGVPSGEQGTAPTDDLARVLDNFGQTVADQWRREEQLRRIHDPLPMPVSWQPAPATLTDHWANVRQLPRGASARPVDLRGPLADIVDVYRRIPSGRLVVLGRAGAGKTILTIRFVLDKVQSRASGDPVPVIFRLNSWNPAADSLRDWLVDQLLADYPTLSAYVPSRERTFGAILVDDGHILPVLDGLDEVAPGLQPDAIRAINATAIPLLLTSRVEEFTRAVDESDVVTAAAVITLSDLSVGDLRSYLPRTARRLDVGKGRLTTKWSPVLTRLPQATVLRSVLTTPLMVSLARTVYSDNATADPIELLDTVRFGTRRLIENHLLDSYIREVYRSRGPERWTAADAEQWLGNLARHLRSLGTRDFAWWELRNEIAPPARLLLFALLGAAGAGLALFPVWPFGAGLGLGFSLIPALWTRGRQPIRSPFRFRRGGLRTVGLLAVCMLSGSLGGLAGGRISSYTGALVLDPFVGRASSVSLDSPWGFLAGVGAGVALSAASSFELAGTSSGPRPSSTTKILLRGAILAFLGALIGGVAIGPVGGVALALTACPMAGLVAQFETVIDVKFAASPLQSLRTDSRNSNMQRLLLGSCFGFSVCLAGLQKTDPVTSVALGLGSAFVIGFGNGLVGTAYGQWLIARTYLALIGRTPFALARFLDDAHRRGVLRQAGAVFQFRHVRLQERLAAPAAAISPPAASQ
jgi:hypothetical protein